MAWEKPWVRHHNIDTAQKTSGLNCPFVIYSVMIWDGIN